MPCPVILLCFVSAVTLVLSWVTENLNFSRHILFGQSILSEDMAKHDLSAFSSY